MTNTTEILIDGLTFTEAPRWHEGRLYFSDFFTHQVLAVDIKGQLETIVKTPYQPSGLGWLPDGSLLIVSMNDQKLLCFNNGELTEAADLSTLANHYCNDMVVDRNGNAYIGNFGCLTAFDINSDATLSNRRVWADLSVIEEGYVPVPDGICLDAEGAIWVASPSTNDVIRIEEGGSLLDKIEVDMGAFACMLGGEKGNTLFISTAKDSQEEICLREKSARIETVEVNIPRAGLP